MLSHRHVSTLLPLKRAIGAVILAAALPLVACTTGTEPTEPTLSAPTETSEASETADSSPPDPVGRWTSPEPGEPFLEFEKDGVVTGSDGCNRIETTWEIDGSKILITPFVAAQKACSGGTMWLSDAASATIEDDVMKVMDSSGSVIGGLEKSDK